jgi:hypothetical protein
MKHHTNIAYHLLQKDQNIILKDILKVLARVSDTLGPIRQQQGDELSTGAAQRHM